MKTCVAAVTVCALAVLVCSSAAAQSAKFGYVDIQRAVTESAAGKDAMEKFKGTVSRMETTIMTEKEQIERLAETMQRQSMMLTDDIRREREKELLRRQRDYERQVKDSQAELQIKEAELTNDILEELIPIIQKYGKDNNYTFIFERSDKVLLYAVEDLNLTDTLIALFDAQYTKRKK
jgi:outer membrane protein